MKRILKASIFSLTTVLLVGLFSAQVYAQAWTVTIWVYVRDVVTFEPIEFASVSFVPPGFLRSTDQNGFVQESITTTQDRISVSASAPGFVSQTQFVFRSSAGRVVTISFYLEREAPPEPPPPEPPPEPPPPGGEPICALPPPAPVNLCQLEGIEDPNPNDTICCPPIVTQLTAVDHVLNDAYLPCGVEVGRGDAVSCPGESGLCGGTGQSCNNLNKCDIAGGCNPACCGADRDCPGQTCSIANGYCVTGRSCNPNSSIEAECYSAGPDPCYEWRSARVSRQIGITLLHPYLNELWRMTTNVPAGFFNILRPYARPRFEDIEGKSQIRYSASGVDISPSVGDFFYPHLGGIQRAKEEAVRTVTPQEAIGR